MIAKTFAPFSGVKPFAIMKVPDFGTCTPPSWRTAARWRTAGTTSTASTAARWRTTSTASTAARWRTAGTTSTASTAASSVLEGTQPYSTVTLLARLRGLSMSRPSFAAM
jgi:hypothetical protein